MREVFCAILFVALVPIFSGIAFSEEPSRKIRIGAMAELSGPGALNGEACLLGYKIAENLFRSRFPEVSNDIEIIIGDHRRDQRTAISEFNRFDSLGVVAVVSNHGIIGAAISPISARKRIPLFGVMGHESFVKDNEFAFRIIPTPQQEGGGLAEQAYRDGARRAAVLVLEDDYILAVATHFEARFRQLGGEVVYKDFFDEAFTEFRPISARIRGSKPDVIMMTLGFQQFGPAIRRLRELGVAQPIYSNYWLSYPEVNQSAGETNTDGSVFITERSDSEAFLGAFHRLAPAGFFRSGVVYRCYSALASALAVIGNNPEVRSREDYVGALKDITELELPDRVLRFNGREAQFEMEFYRLQAGKPERIE